jgi:hypothetical protein
MQPPRQSLIGCERYFLGIKHENGDTIRYKTFPVKCNSWDCPVCARVKADRYKLRMRPLFESHQLYLYTFTFYHSLPAVETWKQVSKRWNRFRTAASKKFGRFSYARVLEHHHASPYPHIHVLADINIPAVWFARELKTAGFGYQADVRPITTLEAGTYVTKYLTKPWVDERCKTIRKTLRLRIITFGGDACMRKLTGTPWEIVYKSIFCQDVIDQIEIDRDWLYGMGGVLSYERTFDSYREVSYVFENRTTSFIETS